MHNFGREIAKSNIQWFFISLLLFNEYAGLHNIDIFFDKYFGKQNKTKQTALLTGTDSHKLLIILGIEKEISTFDETIE